MIASTFIGSTSYVDYYGTTVSSYGEGWTISYPRYTPSPLKVMMKHWAKERMRMEQSLKPVNHTHPKRVTYDRPVPLRNVRLNGHGWAI